MAEKEAEKSGPATHMVSSDVSDKANTNSPVDSAFKPPPCLTLPNELLSCILRLCVAQLLFKRDSGFDELFHRRGLPPNNLANIARVCKRFNNICADVTFREKMLYLQFDANNYDRASPCSMPGCVGGPGRCFCVSHVPNAIDGEDAGPIHIPAKVFNGFQTVYLRVAEQSNLHQLMPSCVFFEVGEEWGMDSGVASNLEHIKMAVAPFRRLRGLKKVMMSSRIIRDDVSIFSNGSDCEDRVQKLHRAEVKLFRKARQEMMVE
ncbi:MAG: hypothetical protein M1831_006596 [Alyxoria varia]|nr:MAG: hypothetical protein M1831_006596 [Alyxoria varia]